MSDYLATDCDECGHEKGWHSADGPGPAALSCKHKYCSCPNYSPRCACVYVAGDHPRCPVHGEGTPWRAEFVVQQAAKRKANRERGSS